MAQKAKQLYSPDDEKRLMAELWSPEVADDPLMFVMTVFPWGKKGTPLENEKGPRRWQIEELKAIRDHLKEQHLEKANRRIPKTYNDAVASGRGIGKSAMVAWLVLWNMSCNIGSTTVVTANTEQQLTSRTWAELGKWHTMAMNAHWFDRQAMSLRPAEWFEALLKEQLKIDTGYYYAQAQLWSEEKPDAFAGVHNHNGITVIFDEASGIPQSIWTVTEGFFTEPVVHRYWFAFSNPRNNTGAFFECFHKFRGFWRTRNIDARTVEGTDPATYARYMARGEDSDEARVEVKGQFPNSGSRQFIPMDFIRDARQREVYFDPGAPLVLGVDVARYGEDSSVIAFRRGRDARSIPWQRYRGLSTMDFTDRVADAITKYRPDAVVIDANGVGGAVADRLRQLGYRCHEVHVQGAPSDKDRYLNKRAEIHDLMKDWLKSGAIPDDDNLADDLKSAEYKFSTTKGVLQLESKEEVKGRGLASPDNSDALSMTFAVSPARSDLRSSRSRSSGRVATDMDYDILSVNR